MRRQGKGSTKGGAQGKAASDPVNDPEGYFDHVHLDEATVRELTRRIVYLNLTGTEEGQAGIKGGHGAQAVDLILLLWAMADAEDEDERGHILLAVKEESVREIDAAWRAVDTAALERLGALTVAARKGAR